jgi:hypothetical protein
MLCDLPNSGRAAAARRTPHAQLLAHATKARVRAGRPGGLYVRLHVLGRPHRHGRAAQRALAPIGPYRVARARAPAALHRPVAADRFGVPRHRHGTRPSLQRARRRDGGDGFWGEGCAAQKGLGRLLHRGGTRCIKGTAADVARGRRM